MRPSSNTEELPVHVFILWCSFPLFCLVDVCHCIQFIAWAKHIKQLMFVLLQDLGVPKNTNTCRWDLKNWCRLCFCPPDGTLLSGCTGDCPSAYKDQLEVHFGKSGHPRRRGRFIRRRRAGVVWVLLGFNFERRASTVTWALTPPHVELVQPESYEYHNRCDKRA